MSREFDELIENGEIYRKRVCDRCGAVGYDKMVGWKKEDWRDPEPDFGLSAFAQVSVPGRGYATLCQPCLNELVTICREFFRRPPQEAEE